MDAQPFCIVSLDGGGIRGGVRGVGAGDVRGGMCPSPTAGRSAG
jgi:hypothetical protein